MKQLIRVINNYIIQTLLFFVYFIAVGVAYMFYRLQKRTSKDQGFWKKTIYEEGQDYFLFPY